MQNNKGISPILATVILIAVTLVIAVGVIGWVMGIWGGMGKYEALKIISGNIYTNGTLYLDVINQGNTQAEIYKITVGNVACTPQGTTVISPGSEPVTISANCGGMSVSVGVTYSVTVITKSGNQYFYNVVGVQ